MVDDVSFRSDQNWSSLHPQYYTGHIRDDVDPRDWKYANYVAQAYNNWGPNWIALRPPTSSVVLIPLPPPTPIPGPPPTTTRLDLTTSGNMPPVYTQGALGSCTSNATASEMEFVRTKEKLSTVMPSRLFNYWTGRFIEGGLAATKKDTGVQIRDRIKALAQYGICTERLWPYNLKKYTVQPPPGDYTAALKDMAINYYSIGARISLLETCLAEGYPFVFGGPIYQPFYNVGKNGIVPMPKGAVVGYHCMKVVGYNRTAQQFKVKNSWGIKWGQNGYCYFPYAYMMSFCYDFWTIRSTTLTQSI